MEIHGAEGRLYPIASCGNEDFDHASQRFMLAYYGISLDMGEELLNRGSPCGM